MALYKWKCSKCKHTVRRLLDSRPVAVPFCPFDDSMMVEDIGVSTQVMERLDNGVMVKALERPRDAEALQKQHADFTKPKDDGIV